MWPKSVEMEKCLRVEIKNKIWAAVKIEKIKKQQQKYSLMKRVLHLNWKRKEIAFNIEICHPVKFFQMKK